MGSQENSSAPPIRLAILEADTPLPQTQARYGSYGGVFTDLFARAVAPAPVSSALTIRAHQVVPNPGPEPLVEPAEGACYPSLDAVDALLVTGSRHSAFAEDPWISALVAYVRRALEGGRVRVVGVCFGHQIVGRALGAPLGVNPAGWEVSVTEVRLSEKGRELFGGRETLKIHQMHRDSVFAYPKGTEPLAENENCSVQGILIPGKTITVQGHPEFTEDIVRELLEARKGIFPEGVYDGGVSRVAKEHDGVVVAQAFLKFLRD